MAESMLGSYKIIREIGRSNDIVYEAMDTKMNRRVALKELLIPPNLAGVQRQERIQRFNREARAAGSLVHPNIVTIFETGQDRGRNFIAMEYLEGQALRNILDIEGSLSIDRAVDIAFQVCEALSYAHSKGVVHRDIKPENIQVLPSGVVKITDFGIARIMDEPTITADGQVFGTPSYMSPEQVSGKALDNRSDLFSLGVVLYEMIAGRKPFTGDTVVTITYNIMNQEVPIISSVPAHIERTIRRALAKDPQCRYRTADEMASELSPSTAHAPLIPPLPDQFSTAASTQMPSINSPRSSMPPPPVLPPPMPPRTVPDPFGGFQPAKIPVMKARKPVMSAETSYFLKALFVVLVVTGLLIAFAWVVYTGFQGFSSVSGSSTERNSMEKGMEHMRQQNYDAAVEEFQKARAKPETEKEARRNIAQALVEKGTLMEKGGNTSSAMLSFKQALQYDENCAEAYVGIGRLMLTSKKSDDALANWAKAIEIGGNGKAALEARQLSAEVYIEIGDEAYNQGGQDYAVTYWKKAMEIAPGTPIGREAQWRIEYITSGYGQAPPMNMESGY